MKKHIHISIPIYKAWIYVVADIEECVKLSSLKTGVQLNKYDFDALGMTVHGYGRNVLWLPLNANVDTVVHECTHAVLNIFKTKGIDVDTDNQEPTAYLMGYVTQKVITAHNKLKEMANDC